MQIPNSILPYYDWMLDYRTTPVEPRLQITIPRSNVVAGTPDRPAGPITRRIPIRAIYQVAKIEIETPPAFPNPIFIDDPRYVASGFLGAPGVGDTPEMLNTEPFWLSEFAGARIKVSYLGTDITKSFSVAEMRSMNLYSGQLHGENHGFDMILPGDQRMVMGELVVPAVDNWGARVPKVAFRYYGETVKQNIPVYNRLVSIQVTPRVGDVVIMNGYGDMRVNYPAIPPPPDTNRGPGPYWPDDEWSFFQKIRVSATYAMQADTSRTAVRQDIQADMDAGRLRPVSIGVPGAEGPVRGFGDDSSARDYGIHLVEVVGAIGSPAGDELLRRNGANASLLIPANDGYNITGYHEEYFDNTFFTASGDRLRNPASVAFANMAWAGVVGMINTPPTNFSDFPERDDAGVNYPVGSGGRGTADSILTRELSERYRTRGTVQRVVVGFGSIRADLNYTDDLATPGAGNGNRRETEISPSGENGLGVRTARVNVAVIGYPMDNRDVAAGVNFFYTTDTGLFNFPAGASGP